MNTSKIISPQWVVDCIKEQKILDYTKYLLYTNQKKSQPAISFIKKKKEETEVISSNDCSMEDELSKGLKTINDGLKELNEQMRQNKGAQPSRI
ncbi:hypothetical protein DOY81_014699 [Sarcophaga bullata]|nr:hypothetical protein DOY81_014699 [Sarcophaga bullata]